MASRVVITLETQEEKTRSLLKCEMGLLLREEQSVAEDTSANTIGV